MNRFVLFLGAAALVAGCRTENTDQAVGAEKRPEPAPAEAVPPENGPPDPAVPAEQDVPNDRAQRDYTYKNADDDLSKKSGAANGRLQKNVHGDDGASTRIAPASPPVAPSATDVKNDKNAPARPPTEPRRPDGQPSQATPPEGVH